MDTIDITAIVKRAGGDQAVAQAFGISWQAVQLWRKSRVPAERVLKLSQLSGVEPNYIRPDVFGDP